MYSVVYSLLHACPHQPTSDKINLITVNTDKRQMGHKEATKRLVVLKRIGSEHSYFVDT